jgi:hypothetical protein
VSAVAWLALGLAFACATAILLDPLFRGLLTAYPANAWLIGRDVKEAK